MSDCGVRESNLQGLIEKSRNRFPKASKVVALPVVVFPSFVLQMENRCTCFILGMHLE